VLPFNVAVAAPDPAIVACIDTSIGTGDNRARYCDGWAWRIPEKATAKTRADAKERVMGGNDTC
jgi:hypothetical protein